MVPSKKAKKQAQLRKIRQGISKIIDTEEDKELIEEQRKAFTPNWNQNLVIVESLPIKYEGKIISKTRIIEAVDDEDSDYGIANDGESHDISNGSEVLVATADTTAPVEFSEFEFGLDEIDEDHINFSNPEYWIEDSTPDVTENVVNVPMQKAKQQKQNLQQSSSKSKTSKSVSAMKISHARAKIAEICSSVSSSPESSLKRRIKDSDDDTPRLIDLFSFFGHSDGQIVELAMLSAVVLFKDILPGYRIRASEDFDNSVRLKKETKRLRDYEKALLGAYQRYLKFLDSKIQDGLGSPRKEVNMWNEAANLGLSALRCQCELIRAIPHFNFRSVLLGSIVTRASQLTIEVYSLCCETLVHVIKKDVHGETSYDCVRIIAKVLAAAKYNVPEALLRCLEVVKVRVHADDAKNIRKKCKQERRKRKRQGDEVEAGLLEATTSNEMTSKRYQADVLHEICLIYFRIIKMKVGFKLLPVALEGLGRITHLINIDTVEDLLILMRTLLEAKAPPAPPLISLNCVYCALRTLNGPGQEVGIDDEVFICSLRTLLRDVAADFPRWDMLLECIELCLVTRRETRHHHVKAIIQLLLTCSSHLDNTVSIASLALAHSVLLKYPAIRNSLVALSTTRLNDDDSVEDYAMKALKNNTDEREEEVGDVSWVLSLFKLHVDPRFKTTIGTLTGIQVAPIPFRASDARVSIQDSMNRLDILLKSMPTKLSSNKTKSVKGLRNEQRQYDVSREHRLSEQLSHEQVNAALKRYFIIHRS